MLLFNIENLDIKNYQEELENAANTTCFNFPSQDILNIIFRYLHRKIVCYNEFVRLIKQKINFFHLFSLINLSMYPICVGIIFSGNSSKPKNLNSVLSPSGFNSPENSLIIYTTSV